MARAKRLKKKAVKSKDRSVAPSALPEVLADTARSLAKRLGLSPALAVIYRPTLLRLLSDTDGDEPKPPDYSKEGSTGTRAGPNIAFLWAPGTGWVRLVLKKPASDCEAVVVEADYFEETDPCPPPDGFASLVGMAEDKAMDFAKLLTCPEDECPGRYIYVSYRQWRCEKKGNKTIASACVQVTRLCGVI
ncbi:MAG: hypothetical protein E6G97_17620 [Alphaproteobacteria bacterium]|nr:MAG: hypothetical protein E6G97_17620 [Alphaproteobacteria bacterium]